MMRLKPWFIFFLFRQALPVTLAAAPLGWGYVLLYPQVFRYGEPLAPELFVLAHALALSVVMGRPQAGWFAFLHTRGLSMPALWANMLAAYFAAVLAVWLPAALFVWCRTRSALHDAIERPEFPVMAAVEDVRPWGWLALYACAAVVLHYGWVRRAQPVRGRGAGRWLALFALLTAATFVVMRGRWWLLDYAAPVAAIVALLLIIGARRLYPRMEVGL